MDTALQTLLLAAGLAAPSLPPAPAVRARAAAAPVVELARLPVASIAAAQERGAVERTLAGSPLWLAAAFDFNGDAWLKLSAAGEQRALPLSALASGADAALGGRALRVSRAADAITVSAGGDSVQVSYMSLVDALFKAARHVRPHEALDYAVEVEAARGGMPASVCLIRRDGQGTYWVTFRKPEQLNLPQWFAAVNGVLKGFLADGADLVFVEKAIETLSVRAQGPAPLFERAPERLVRLP